MAGMRSGERWAGDTECYWENKLDEITDFIREYLNEIEPRNYSAELEKFEVPNFFQRNRFHSDLKLFTGFASNAFTV